MITATVGTGAPDRRRRLVGRDRPAALRYESWYARHLPRTPAIALGWFHQIPTGNELILDTVAADYWRGLYLATLALARRLPRRGAARQRVPLPAARRRGRRRGPGRRLAAHHRPPARPARAPAPGQFFLWRFLDRGLLVGVAPVLALGRARRASRSASRSRTSATTPRRMGEIRRGTRVVAEGPFGVFTEAARTREKVLLDRRRHRHHADPGAARGDGRRHRRPLPRRHRGGLVFRDELERARARARDRRSHYVVGDHATAEGARPALARAPAASSSPTSPSATSTSAGPPAMTDVLETNLRAPASRDATSTSSASRSD